MKYEESGLFLSYCTILHHPDHETADAVSFSGEQLSGGKGGTACKCRNLIYTSAVDRTSKTSLRDFE